MEKVWRFAIEERLGVAASDCPAVVLLDSLQQGPKDLIWKWHQEYY